MMMRLMIMKRMRMGIYEDKSRTSIFRELSREWVKAFLPFSRKVKNAEASINRWF